MLTTEEIAQRFGARRTGSGYLGVCPCHADRQASLSISEGRDGRTLLYCHAGCDVKDILAAANLRWQDLNPATPPAYAPLVRGEQTARYDYPDAQGQPRLRKVRLRLPDGGKSFYWQHLEAGAWTKGRGGMEPGVYRRAALAEGMPALLVEGEKDADTLVSAGIPFAVSLPDGAAEGGAKWRDSYAEAFRGRIVYLMPDHDAVGRGFMNDIAARLQGIAAEVRWVDLQTIWPEIPEKADVSDYLQAAPDRNAAIAALGKLYAEAPLWQRPAPEPEQRMHAVAWPEPKMPERPRMPSFPTEALPDIVGDYVRAVSDAMQTAPEMAGTMALGLLAAAFQGRYDVRVTGDWVEPLCLYTVAVAGPGERKSPTMKALLGPAYAAERDMRQGMLIAVERSREELNLLLARREAARKAAAKATTPDEAQRYSETAIALTGEIAAFEPVRPTRWFADDTTPEELISMLEEYRGCLTIASAEGGLFGTMGGRYEKNGNLDVYLKGHAGDPITVDRVGRTGNCVPDPRLSMLLMIQPTVLEGLMSSAEARGRGLCARFLFAICPSRVGSRQTAAPAIPPDVSRAWQDLMHRLFSQPLPDTRLQLTLSREADAERRRFQETVERRLGGGWLDIQDWGGKLVGTTMRISALLHCACRECPEEAEISADTVRAAIRLAAFFVPHAMEAYRLMGAAGEQNDVEYLLKALQMYGEPEIKKRDLLRRCCARFDSAEQLDAALLYLEELGWVQLKEHIPPTGGRKAKYVLLHPDLQRKNKA